MLPNDSAVPTAIAPALHPSVTEIVRQAQAVLTEVLGPDLTSYTVIGHAVTEGLSKGQMLQSLVVAGNDADLFHLAQRIAGVSDALQKSRVGPPLLVTGAYIDRSRDVFPVELLHMQLWHHTLTGTDPFEALCIDKTHVRSQCEREAKRYMLHIRQGVMRSDRGATLLHDILAELLEAVIPLFGAVLYYKGVQRPQTRATLFEAFGRTIGVDVAPFEQDLSDASGQRALKRDQYAPVLHGCYTVLETLTKWIDEAG